MPWTKLGIDLLLGVGADKPMSPMEVMFLPDYLAKGIAMGTAKGKQLILTETIALPDTQDPVIPIPFWRMPIFIISLLVVILLIPFALNLFKWKRVADNILLILTGVLGVFLSFMWLGTDHQSFSKNLNLIWAMPFNLVIAFFADRNGAYVRRYFNVYSMLLIMLMAMGLVYQELINFSLYPLLAFLSYRSWMISRPDKKMLKP
jgi:hypothetical protein